jgi:hypothetical protein
MNSNKVTFAAIAAMAVVLSVAMLASSVAAPAAAKIEEICRNPGGQEPQANDCPDPHEKHVNPALHEPPGQNK